MRARDLANFIKAREAARLGKGTDPIIAKYRFCNMVRADDRVTKYIFGWAGLWKDADDLWFVFVVARLFNLPGTLDELQAANCVLPFVPEKMRKVAKRRRDRGDNVFNAAYIVSTNGIAMDKIDYVVDRVLAPLYKDRKRYRPAGKGWTLSYLHQKLCEAQGLGSFMAAQIVADLKYFPPYMSHLGIPNGEGNGGAEDWWTFAASGPGSRRGLNRVMDRPIKTTWMEAIWRATLSALIAKVRPMLPPSIGTRMSAQDYQNSLCEFDKYERARLGEGEPKQIYKPFNKEK